MAEGGEFELPVAAHHHGTEPAGCRISFYIQVARWSVIVEQDIIAVAAQWSLERRVMTLEVPPMRVPRTVERPPQ